MMAVTCPALYQINTRVWLTRIGRRLGRTATLDDVDDAALDRITDLGFDWVWLLGVWQTGEFGRRVSRENPQWQQEYRAVLPDLSPEDICGSGFAITRYRVHAALGGPSALARLRERMRRRGLALMLDFVPNHTAVDHHWVEEDPDFYVHGTDADLARAPENWVQVDTGAGPSIIAHGRDPYFPGWPDTLQLDFANADLREAQCRELVSVAGQCDGVRCDMAMLVLPEVFRKTWGRAASSFWPEAIARVRRNHPGFTFMAEVYWDLEWSLQQEGFDYTYDKRLYDRLRERNAPGVRDHLVADLDFQNKLARFLENHDEPRAAAAFPLATHRAAAVVTYLSPGLRFFHQGQLEGRKIRIPMHLGRGPDEARDPALAAFYDRLLAVLKRPLFRNGAWRRIDPRPAGENDRTYEGFIACVWEGGDGARVLCVVNYSHAAGQCRLPLALADLRRKAVRLVDLMSDVRYVRSGDELAAAGLFVDMPPWGYHVFEMATD
ncbi:MAG: alpha-amylase [Rhodospirillales bacterium]|nr:alpha-amylase [Rhodospirillales bacterium]